MKIIVFFIMAIPVTDSPNLNWDWTTEDTILQITYTGLSTIDWLQTRSEAERGWVNLNESNLFLNRKPNTSDTDIAFLLSSLSALGVSVLLPNPYRSFWLKEYIEWITLAIQNNHQLGARINFKF